MQTTAAQAYKASRGGSYNLPRLPIKGTKIITGRRISKCFPLMKISSAPYSCTVRRINHSHLGCSPFSAACVAALTAASAEAGLQHGSSAAAAITAEGVTTGQRRFY